MNENINAIDRFDSKRLKMTARYYQSSILPVMLVIFTVSAICCILMVSTRYSILLGLLGSMLMSIPSLIAYFAPLTLNVGHQPVMNSMLPATSGEKLAVLAAAYLIINPLLVYLPSVLFSNELINNMSGLTSISSTVTHLPTYYYIISIANTIAPCATCLYSVIRWPGNKTKAILLPLAVSLVMFITGAVFGIMTAFKQGVSDGFNGSEHLNTDALAKSVINDMLPLSTVMSAALAIYTIIIVWATYKALKSRQL